MGANLAVGLALRLGLAKLSRKPPVTALEEYQGSDLEKIVDAIADISGAERDESGSFDTTISTETEKLHFTFKRQAEPDVAMPGIRVALEGEYKEVIETELEGGGKMTRSFDESGSASYNLNGKNVTPLKMQFPRILSFLTGPSLPMPNEAATFILGTMQSTAPATCAEVVERTGLTPPPKAEHPLLGLFGF
jgi:hypothetical protein